MHMIYVAGPVLRRDSLQRFTELGVLYDALEEAAKQADVEITVPIADPELDELSVDQVMLEVTRRIGQADSLVALLDAPGARESTNLAVAGEAHTAASMGKVVAIVARDPYTVPKMLQAVTPFDVQSYDTDFPDLFRALAEESDDEAPPTPIAMA